MPQIRLPFKATDKQRPFTRSSSLFKLGGGARGGGKALPLDTPLPTPHGWTTMGAVLPGDYLLDAEGQPTMVLGKSGVQYGRDVYRLTLSDGSTVEADGEHLWTLLKRGGSRTREVTITTREVVDTLRHGTRGDLTYSVQNSLPLGLPEAELPLDPYCLGVWLGDGTSDAASITVADGEILSHFVSAGFPVKKWSGPYTWGIGNGFRGLLRSVGVFRGKHIPAPYLRSSFSQRLALLQGLMDTDGTCLPGGQCEYYGTSPLLIANVSELLHTLGIKHRVSEGRATLYGKDCGPKWRIKFNAPFHVFRLPRKRDRQRTTLRPSTLRRVITSIVQIPSVPVQCVYVDNERHLYLAGHSFVPTHNSHCLAGMAVELSFKHPGNVGYMGRADLLDFKKTTLPLVLDMIPQELLVRHQAQDHYIDILSIDGKTTSRMWYGEMKDPGSLLSGNIGWFFIDESYEVPEETFVNLAGALRGTLPNGQPRPYYGLLASNPAPGWLVGTFPVTEEEQRLFSEAVQRDGPNFAPFPSPYQPNPENVKMIDPDYQYFPFRARDNPYNGPGYEERLIKQYGKLGQAWVSRMVYGVWDTTMEGLVYALEPAHLWRPKTVHGRLYRPGLPVELAGDPSNGAGVYGVLVLQRWRNRVLVVDEFHKPGGSDEDFREWFQSKPYASDIDDGIFDPAKPDTIRRLRNWGIQVRGMKKQKNVTDQINAVKAGMAISPDTGVAQLLIDEGMCPELVAEFRKRVYRKRSSRNPDLRVPEQPVKAHDHLLNALEYWYMSKMPFGVDYQETGTAQEQIQEIRGYLRLYEE